LFLWGLLSGCIIYKEWKAMIREWVAYSFGSDTQWISDGKRWLGGFIENSIPLSMVRLEGDTLEFTKLPFHCLIFVVCDLVFKTNTHGFSSLF